MKEIREYFLDNEQARELRFINSPRGQLAMFVKDNRLQVPGYVLEQRVCPLLPIGVLLSVEPVGYRARQDLYKKLGGPEAEGKIVFW